MNEASKTPTRHARAIEAAESFVDDIPQMMEIARHNRRNHAVGEGDSQPRVVKASVSVEVVQEVDGSESIVVKGDGGILAAKGVLHDAIYALIHTP